MNKIIKFWNQNRKQLIIMMAILAFIIIIIRVLDNFAAMRLESENERERISSETTEETQPIKSVITGQKASKEDTEENVGVVKDFIELCNNKEYEKAFSLLTQDCQGEFNNDLNTFINNYAKRIFNTSKTYKLELWYAMNNAYTYKIQYYENNLLATGNSNLTNNIEDYISILRENDETKISINNFIKKENINKSQKVNDIEIIVNYKKMYRDYEEYNITIKNLTSKDVLLSDGKDSKDICLVDDNNIEYSSYLHEIPIDNLTLKSGYQVVLNVKFNKMYNAYRNIKRLKFGNIILDKESYEKSTDKDSIEKTEINIEM